MQDQPATFFSITAPSGYLRLGSWVVVLVFGASLLSLLYWLGKQVLHQRMVLGVATLFTNADTKLTCRIYDQAEPMLSEGLSEPMPPDVAKRVLEKVLAEVAVTFKTIPASTGSNGASQDDTWCSR